MTVNTKSRDIPEAKVAKDSAAAHLLPGLPVPVLPLRPVFAKLIRELSFRHPALFERLGGYGRKMFLIDPVDMPVVLQLVPDAFDPKLVPFARKDKPDCDAVISGAFMSLVRLVSGKVDGDALFFSRELEIKGDTEAVLALRNAIDDMDIDLVEEIEDLLGPLGAPLELARKQVENMVRQWRKAQDAILAPVSGRLERLEREIADIRRGAGGGVRTRRGKSSGKGAA